MPWQKVRLQTTKLAEKKQSAEQLQTGKKKTLDVILSTHTGKQYANQSSAT